MKQVPDITNTDYWFKVVDFLQQNWGVIEPSESGCTVYFFEDTSGIFDQLNFSSISDAKAALKRNGFSRFEEDKEAQEVIAKPEQPFRMQAHPNGFIYSSGRYWR
ncbi:MAG: hypothetical protein GX087_08245 [Desulfobulbaceae bacterium]|nr:hypothetical protein [Desulfobulbaceae bacterium]